ncbi:MAG: hypothetical protein ACOVLB_07285 [Candidatus Nanopelagicus sp.]
MNQEETSVWIKSTEEKLQALLADEARQAPMLNEMLNTVKQLKAKNSFRIAIINQLIEEKTNEHQRTSN